MVYKRNEKRRRGWRVTVRHRGEERFSFEEFDIHIYGKLFIHIVCLVKLILIVIGAD